MNRKWHHISIILLAGILVFINSLHNSFHLDDYDRVENNPEIRRIEPIIRHFIDPRTMSAHPYITQFRPLLPLTLSFNYALTGNSLPGYRITNILIHLFSAIFVYLMFLELIRQQTNIRFDPDTAQNICLISALMFTIHPLSGVPVNYICARDLLLMQMFLMMGLFVYIRMRRSDSAQWPWILIVVLISLSILSKTNTVVIPLIILLFEMFIKRKRIFSVKMYLRSLPFWIVVASFFMYTKFILNFSDLKQLTPANNISMIQSLWTQSKVHMTGYLPNFFLPYFIHIQAYADHPSITDPAAILSAATIIGIVFLAWKFRSKMPILTFCIASYWIMMIPESSVLSFHTFRADYRPYPSSIYFYFLLSYLIFVYFKPRVRSFISGGIVFYFAFSSIFMNQIWSTEERLWRHSVKLGGTALAHHNLAMSVEDLNERKHYLQEALRLNPGYILAHVNLGLTLINLGNKEQGLAYCEKAVQLDPTNANSHYWLSSAYRFLGRYQDAFRSSLKAAQLDPRNFMFLYQAAVDLQTQGDYLQSLHYLDTILKVDPYYEKAMFYQAFALQRLGRLDESIGVYQQFLKDQSGNYQAWFNFSHALMSTGRYQEAINGFLRTLDLNPDYREAHYHLGTCYQSLGDPGNSEKHFSLYQSSGKST